jgi:ATP-dependent HslUV protease ATP-binding subunit HslU
MAPSLSAHVLRQSRRAPSGAHGGGNSPALLNDRIENIGARRLHTVMSTLLEDLLFDLPDVTEKHWVFDADAVKGRLLHIVDDEDLRKYIL